ncbi:hypothetical protein BN1088_1433347 [Sphingobacterium sp. PM2-P1-29]|nr:hypothetical protein BN1088_1433347 [Sphingobacterium sp. PM2-P1-29]
MDQRINKKGKTLKPMCVGINNIKNFIYEIRKLKKRKVWKNYVNP